VLFRSPFLSLPFLFPFPFLISHPVSNRVRYLILSKGIPVEIFTQSPFDPDYDQIKSIPRRKFLLWRLFAEGSFPLLFFLLLIKLLPHLLVSSIFLFPFLSFPPLSFPSFPFLSFPFLLLPFSFPSLPFPLLFSVFSFLLPPLFPFPFHYLTFLFHLFDKKSDYRK